MAGNKEKITAIILSAGSGSRMNSDIKKQYMLLGDYPVVYYSIKVFHESQVDEIILVTGEDEIEYCKKEIVDKYGFKKVSKVVAGGKERFNSVYNGLMAADAPGYVLIHDGARPFVTQKMIDDSLEAVAETGSVTVGMPVKDTIKIVDDDCYGVDTPARKYVWQVQTPQTFDYKKLVESYDKMFAGTSVNITDDTMLIEAYGECHTKLIEGAYTNIKITTPEDIKIAEIFLKNVLTCNS